MMSAETAKRWFGRVTLVGVAANLALALPTIAAPAMMTEFARLPGATPDVWVRLSGLLLVIISGFYTPAALDPDRYRAAAWISVASRFAGTVFFFMEPSGYRLFGLFDFVFFLPEVILLTIATRAEATARPVSVA